jgi:hypothetical protein
MGHHSINFFNIKLVGCSSRLARLWKYPIKYSTAVRTPDPRKTFNLLCEIPHAFIMKLRIFIAQQKLGHLCDFSLGAAGAYTFEVETLLEYDNTV